uniref:No apical meristem-associated C-terminal domain-containing protein n=1 Tax=Oryza brachyantha TaxID=4533 RepID=J3MRP4_ORYBR
MSTTIHVALLHSILYSWFAAAKNGWFINSRPLVGTSFLCKYGRIRSASLVGAWLNNSNDPIHANYKKNEQYWKEVTAAYNSAVPKKRARLMKQVKDRFGRIKKRVQWFCGSWKEANALWASGESDVDLMDRAMKLYEEEHKKDGPFSFKHCWDILREEPKWDAYLERIANLDPDKRKFNVDDDVVHDFSIESDTEERPIGYYLADDDVVHDVVHDFSIESDTEERPIGYYLADDDVVHDVVHDFSIESLKFIFQSMVMSMTQVTILLMVYTQNGLSL